ncbi:hypothetical protein [Rhizobium sp.]|jgi:Dyp-type peroxidase family|uniref:Dyp-type peroxidase n=1 Tax=Rhizobium sp. TaxID=391 RepID=UPI000E87331E|nr:hypothetical protein [Rhizobium sp.]
MTEFLDLADIQGNILTAYGKQGFPKGRMLLFTVNRAQAGRAFVELIRPKVTSALRWPSRRDVPGDDGDFQKRPEVAVNLAFTFPGLVALGVPSSTLRGLPDEFIEGMEARAQILGDEIYGIGEDGRESNLWDKVWVKPKTGGLTRVHILVSLNAQMNIETGEAVPALDELTAWMVGLAESSEGGVELLTGHSGPDPRWQNLTAILEKNAKGEYAATPKEHFGYTDGIGDPAFEGQHPPARMKLALPGRGKLSGSGEWSPLATGEFLLGHADEAQEIPGAAMPLDFSRNGTFFAYRKLHENVASFRNAIIAAGAQYQAVAGIGGPPEVGQEALMAKIAGRWSDGIPIMAAPTYEAWKALQAKAIAAKKAGDVKTLAALGLELNDFVYRPDPDGIKCPVTAHIRRINTRDQLDPYFTSDDPKTWLGSVLNNRRRILRRGLPYGYSGPNSSDDGDHGIVMLCVCANLNRQFEFVQQQWINYGLDSNSGNDTCPMVGRHRDGAKFVVPGDPAKDQAPFIMKNLPEFVESRGGDYFFVPSLTALRMIGMGVTDPT